MPVAALSRTRLPAAAAVKGRRCSQAPQAARCARTLPSCTDRTLWIFRCHWDVLQVAVPTRLKRSTPARIDASSATSIMSGTQRGHSETSPPASRSVLTVPNTVKPRSDKPTAACRPMPEEQPVIKTAPASCTRNVCRSTTQSKAETNNTMADRRSKERIRRSRGQVSYVSRGP